MTALLRILSFCGFIGSLSLSPYVSFLILDHSLTAVVNGPAPSGLPGLSVQQHVASVIATLVAGVILYTECSITAFFWSKRHKCSYWKYGSKGRILLGYNGALLLGMVLLVLLVFLIPSRISVDLLPNIVLYGAVWEIYSLLCPIPVVWVLASSRLIRQRVAQAKNQAARSGPIQCPECGHRDVAAPLKTSTLRKKKSIVARRAFCAFAALLLIVASVKSPFVSGTGRAGSGVSALQSNSVVFGWPFDWIRFSSWEMEMIEGRLPATYDVYGNSSYTRSWTWVDGMWILQSGMVDGLHQWMLEIHFANIALICLVIGLIAYGCGAAYAASAWWLSIRRVAHGKCHNCGYVLRMIVLQSLAQSNDPVRGQDSAETKTR